MTKVEKNSIIIVLFIFSMGIVWISIMYQPLSILILAGGVLTIVGLVFRVAKISFNVFLVAITFISELWLGDIDFGPFSLRVYLMTGLFLYLLISQLSDRTSLFSSETSKSLAVFYILFIIWTIFCRLAQGDFLINILSRMISTHMISLMIFVLLQKFIIKPRDYRFFSIVILLAIVISSIIAIIEYAGFEWVFTLKKLLRPLPSNSTEIFSEGNTGAPSGLAPSAFSMSYQIVIGLTILFTLYVFPLLKGWRRFIVFVGLSILVFTIHVVQERSTLVALLGTFFIFGIWILAGVPAQFDGKKKMFQSFLIMVIFGGLFLYYLLFVFPSGSQEVGSRLTNLYDSGRIVLLRQALSFGANYWFFGGGPAMFLLTTSNDFNTHYRTAIPHNLFLNALVYYGFPGLILAIMLCLKLFNDCRKFLWMALVQIDPLMVGVIFALLGYLLNAQFHNASFITGDPLMWWLVGTIYACPVVFGQDQRRKTTNIIRTF